jgi:hypothetical protein
MTVTGNISVLCHSKPSMTTHIWQMEPECIRFARAIGTTRQYHPIWAQNRCVNGSVWFSASPFDLSEEDFSHSYVQFQIFTLATVGLQ